MDRLVTIFAPRGRIDFVLKSISLLILMGAMNWLRDMIEHGPDADGFGNNFLETAFVGIIPTLLAMGLIGHLNKLQDTLQRAAVTDALTGLPNRRQFFEEVKGVLPSPGGVLLMVDADHFKYVNDTFGHGAGDRCLVEIATLLRAQLRHGDVVARLGGEEFGILLIGADEEEARVIGDRLVAGVQLAVGTHSSRHRVTMSVGAMFTAGQANVAHLLSVADAALYQAKEAGRGRMVFADRESVSGRAAPIGPREVA